MNHYNGLSWADIVDMEYDGYAQVLGWDASSWEGDAEPPTSNSKDWSDLTQEEKEAAHHFCFFMELWDRSDLVTWQGKAWPEAATAAATATTPSTTKRQRGERQGGLQRRRTVPGFGGR